MSYLQTRVFDELGVTEAQNTIELISTDGLHGIPRKYLAEIFSSDEHDNIKILCYGLDRQSIEYEPQHKTNATSRTSDAERMHTFYLTRLNPQNMTDESTKYLMPKGAGVYPFFPPTLIEKYESGTEIPTLILTEGYFKAFKGAMHGFDVVGLSSITHYADSKTKRMHSDILRIIMKCHVKNVVMLYDGDCLNISTKHLERKEELTDRPSKFYNSILKVKELLTGYPVTVYFAHINSKELEGNPKGLDDLLLAYPDKHQEILDDMQHIGSPGFYFYKLNVHTYGKRLTSYFNLNSAQSFYSAWSEIIGTREFIFKGSNFMFKEADNRLIMTVPHDLKNFIRVGDTYFEMIKKPNIHTEGFEIIRSQRNKSTIIDDFGKSAIANIPKYKTFISLPSHTNYQAVVHNCYNIYHPLSYEPSPGEFAHIDRLMHHIFGEQYEYGMDYMQLLYTRPTQILPILCLVSRERETGKTSMLDLLKEIYGYNCVVVGNAEIASDFNSFVSGKLIVGVDESSLADNQKVTERLKMLSTAKRAAVQPKGQDHIEIENFTKYVLVSNHETRFIYTQEEETRFWVRKINPIPAQDKVPNILPLLCDEIPAFLAHLSQRQLFVSEAQSRSWFNPEDLVTEALLKLKIEQRPKSQKLITEYLRELFIDFRKREVMLTIPVLREKIGDLKKYDDEHLNRIMREQMKSEKLGPKRFSVPRWNMTMEPFSDSESALHEVTDKYHGRPYLFRAEDYLTAEEIKILFEDDTTEPAKEEIHTQLEVPY